MQVDDRRVLVGPDVALVDAHAPERQGAARAAEALRCADDAVSRESRDGFRALRRIALDHATQCLPPARRRGHERAVEQILAPEHVQHRVQERDVGAGTQREMQVGEIRRLRPAWVGDDHEDGVRVRELAPAHSLERHRMTVGGVAADHEERVGPVDIGVRRGWTIGAEGACVAGRGGGHAQA